MPDVRDLLVDLAGESARRSQGGDLAGHEMGVGGPEGSEPVAGLLRRTAVDAEIGWVALVRTGDGLPAEHGQIRTVGGRETGHDVTMAREIFCERRVLRYG